MSTRLSWDRFKVVVAAQSWTVYCVVLGATKYGFAGNATYFVSAQPPDNATFDTDYPSAVERSTEADAWASCVGID